MLTAESTIDLPARPADLADRAVAAWREPVVIDTYQPEPPDRYPAYLDRRVYQGSSGKIYPLPFFERISQDKTPVSWDAVHLENRWLRLMILPELGGRIHIGQDRTSGYDFFYRNNVIKPALIGLTGPWIAGGVEFNWPQHHRPATYLPTDVSIEVEESGAVTVWCSDHDPLTRMKGMHGIRLHPDRAVVEARVRLYNRDDEPRTFLWWANVAARAHNDYQSFFPTDVRMVADHAKRAVTAFPAADRPYYGIDYPARRSVAGPSAAGHDVPGDRIDWYRNIPVPTSYMCLDSSDDFFGGYDHLAKAGFVHVADHQISVGKKQWTWGNAAFGRAWDRNLADDGAAYVELMAGVFTDNQPDFSFIAPGETKVFSQFWYPIQQIGPAQQATLDAALSLQVEAGPSPIVRIGVATTANRPATTIELRDGSGTILLSERVDIEPGRPALMQRPLPADVDPGALQVQVSQAESVLLTWRQRTGSQPVSAATEPAQPQAVATVDELYRIGVHLAQYRHATRSPEPYWREALRRDPGHPGSCVELAVLDYRRARYLEAEQLLRTAIRRLTMLNPNPADSTAHYYLGLTLTRLGRPDEAYDAFGKAIWNRAWRGPGGFQLARLDAAAGRDRAALDRLDDVLRCEPDHLQARSLRALQLRRVGCGAAAEAALADQLALDPLDWWARDLAGQPLQADPQTCLDVALEYEKAGEPVEALRVLEVAWGNEERLVAGAPAARPLVGYYQARLLQRMGRDVASAVAAERSAGADDRYCFPGRLDDADLLRETCLLGTPAARPHALLGHWLYSVGRRDEAAAAWRSAVELDPTDSVCWRNLGLAAYGSGDLDLAADCYQHAVAAEPQEARLWFERDQLAQRAAVPPADRMTTLSDNLTLVQSRDDATVELAHLLLSLDRPEEAHRLLGERRFQPWEGGEGQALRAWDRASTALARRALAEQAGESALALVDGALEPPVSLGEARHPLANSAGLRLLRGDALEALGRTEEAREEWALAAGQVGDFLSMSSHPFSEATFASIQAYQRLGYVDAAADLMHAVEAFCDDLDSTPAVIDYFATSLPDLLLFPEDLQQAKARRVAFLRAQLDICRGDMTAAQRRVAGLLTADPNYTDAIDLARFALAPTQGETR
ncbi:DUF5107 domain-containing protein [Microlunatus panaciterrae]|uniref:Tetratricopeptide (TPR) repeat protein n=1 Tax=Microlunatus panaciterrae TaxID=400768 RepID=A0ABS2RFX7_9ACTN|nr:DUF5107 domain-containing protein [Microlunatus panaciterrae]MBM7797905.1 tetratricopeptide (TPR) repeat protein [Microlunatus panaciterrae]